MTSAVADVLTVTYGPSEGVRSLLCSLRMQSEAIGVMHIWHNGPEAFDRSLFLQFPELRIEVNENGRNLGYGGGINRSFARSSSSVVVVVNPDVELAPGCLRLLVERAQAEDAPVVVGGLLADVGGKVNAFALTLSLDGVGLNEDRGQFQASIGAARARRAESQAIAPSGALFAVNRRAWQGLGGGPLFPESLFLYLEDVALGLRIRRSGGRMAFCPEARGVHAFSETTGRRSDLKLYHVERNRLWLLRALAGRSDALARFPFTLLRLATYALAGATGPRKSPGADGSLARALIRAWRDGLVAPLPEELVRYLGPKDGMTLRAFQAPLSAQLRDPTR